jgi:Cu/Ag efflux protein CusF
MKKIVSSIVAVAFALPVLAQAPAAAPAQPAASAAAPAPAVPGAGKTVAGVGEVVGVTAEAKVTAVDAKKHTVTLQGPSGATRTYKVNPKFKLDKVKAGDVVVITVIEAVAVSLKGPKSGPAGVEVVDAAAAGKGVVGAEEAVRIAAKITKIDAKKLAVTLQGPAGNKITVKAKDKKALEGLKVGDDVDVTYAEAVVVALAPPAKK